MLISDAVNRMTVGGLRVRYVVHNGGLIYINHDGLRPYLPALKANPNGTGDVVQGGRVQYVEDLTGNGNTAVSPSSTNAPLVDDGGGLYFDGMDDYFRVAPSTSLDFGGKTQMCIEAWVKSSVVGWKSSWSVVSRYNQFILGPNSREMAMLTTPEGGGWRPLNYGDLDWGQTSDSAFDELTWHHYCGVVNTSTRSCKLYVDGVLRAEFSIPNVPFTSDVGDIHIAHRETDLIGTNHHHGRIADVRIWDRVRTQPEIQRDMNRRLLGHESGLKAYWPF